MTFLFDDIIIGPIISRRMGVSLGVNLLPTNGKLCNFNCVYCECGWTIKEDGVKLRFNPTEDVLSRLKDVLKKRNENNEQIDVITFAGNGEPTTHPDFPYIIDETIALRDKYFPNVKISVLTNATLINREPIRNALEKVDTAMLKIDAVTEDLINAIYDPQGRYQLEDVIAGIKKFKGEIIIQTMLLKGHKDGVSSDNTTPEAVDAWLKVIEEINPARVVVYTLDRDTPSKTISRVTVEEMEEIAKRVEALNIKCDVTK